MEDGKEPLSKETLTIDALLDRLGGCGRFQILLTTCASMTYVTCAFSMIFMVFGSYNPGWRCHDNSTLANNYTRDLNVEDDWSADVTNVISYESFGHSCQGFEECKSVEFNPASSTIATEWGLICHQNWKSSVIISLQLFGATLGSTAAGHFADIFGRKFILYTSVLLHSVMNFISLAATSWEIFAGFRFVIGFTIGVVLNAAMVYMSEFVTPRWRAIIASLPVWCLGCFVFSLCAFVFKDWRQLHIFNGVFSTLVLLPSFFCPESVRWLKTHHREEKVVKAVATIARLNRASESSYAVSSVSVDKHSSATKTSNVYITSFFRITHLTRILLLGIVVFSMSLFYYASNFGMAALPGDIYLNSILVFISDLPSNVIVWFVPDIFGRKRTGIVTHLLLTLSLAAFIVFKFYMTGTIQLIGSLVFIIISRICSCVSSCLVVTCTMELFPTVIRSAALGGVFLFAGAGAISSPYLVANDDIMFVSFIAMAVSSLVCCGIFFVIPETMGKDLKDDVSEMDSCENSGEDHQVMSTETI